MKRPLLVTLSLSLLSLPVLAQETRVFSGTRATSSAKQVSDPQPVARAAKLDRGLVSLVDFTRQQSNDISRMKGRGPDVPFSLKDEPVAQLSEFGLEATDLLRLSLWVYPDVNAESHIFYYRPSRYSLRYDPDEGYSLVVDYKGATGEAKNVLVQARLTPGDSPADREVLGALLRSRLRKEGKSFEPLLRPIPATYEAKFDLTDWNVQEVKVNGIDPETGELFISLSADVPTKELLTSTLGNSLGLPGQVVLKPAVVSEGQTYQTSEAISATIRMADLTGGPRPLWRRGAGGKAEVKNGWPFPLTLRSLCYLTSDPATGALRLRGWNLGDTRLEPGDVARIDQAKLNTELGGSSMVTAFYDVSLERNEATVRKVVEGLTGGVGALPVQKLAIEVVKAQALFAQYNVYKIAVEVRSAHFDPKGREVVTHTYEVSDATPRIECEPLYLWEDAGGSLYQFRLGIVTVDGTVHADSAWRSPNATMPGSIFVGAALVEEVLGK